MENNEELGYTPNQPVSKAELKTYFENGDIPTQEQFWQWQDSYWHKNDVADIIPADRVDISSKADKNATNLDGENVAKWRTKLNLENTDIQRISIIATGNITTSTKSAENIGQNNRTVVVDNSTSNINIQCLTTSELDFQAAYFKKGTGSITFTAGAGASIVQLDYSNTLNGGIGSMARLQRVDNTFYVKIYNA